MPLDTPSPIARCAVLHDAAALARRAGAAEPLFLNILADKAHMARIGAVGHLDVDWLAPGLIRERDRWNTPERGLEAQTGLVVGATTQEDRVAFLLGGLVNRACDEVFGSAVDGGNGLDGAVFRRMLLAGHADAFEAALDRAGYEDRETALRWLWRDDIHRALAECHTMSPDMVNSGLWLERMFDQYVAWRKQSDALASAILAEDGPATFSNLPLFLDTDAAFRSAKALRRGAFVPQAEAEEAIREDATCAYGLAVRRTIHAFADAGRLWRGETPALARAA
ncbi:MAG: hypothetical protein ACRC7G_09570 [Beijerinckiaceae bacterium]